jgi:hypothetical protein
LELGLCLSVDSCGRMIWIADAHRDDGKRFVAVASANRSTACCNARMAARRRSHRSVPLIERNRALEVRGTRAQPSRPACHKRPTAKGRRCLTQRAGIASPHAEGDGLSGVTRDGEVNAFISIPAGVVGGVPVTRARNPWAMPEAST